MTTTMTTSSSRRDGCQAVQADVDGDGGGGGGGGGDPINNNNDFDDEDLFVTEGWLAGS